MATRGRPKKRSPFLNRFGLRVAGDISGRLDGSLERWLLSLTPARLRQRLPLYFSLGDDCGPETPQLVALWKSLKAEHEAKKAAPAPENVVSPAPPLTRQQKRALARSALKGKGQDKGFYGKRLAEPLLIDEGELPEDLP